MDKLSERLEAVAEKHGLMYGDMAVIEEAAAIVQAWEGAEIGWRNETPLRWLVTPDSPGMAEHPFRIGQRVRIIPDPEAGR